MIAVIAQARFDAQLDRLAVLRGWPERIEEYFPALSDVPEDVLTAAVDHALKSRTWFPAPAQLREDCDVVKVRVRPYQASYPQVEELPTPKVLEFPNPFGGAPLRITVTREWRHDCHTCSDTGWSSRQCPETRCGRRFEHAKHEFVEACGCIDWNPTIRRRKDAAAKYSQAETVTR